MIKDNGILLTLFNNIQGIYWAVPYVWKEFFLSLYKNKLELIKGLFFLEV